MIKIIPYEQKHMTPMFNLILETIKKYNKSDFTKSGYEYYIHFYNITRNRNHLEESIKSNDICYVALDKTKVVGVVRGSKGYCSNLFVDSRYHGQGIGKMLMNAFEKKCKALGEKEVKIRSSKYAVPFYTAIGYTKTT
ncbi:GNAT family N-acetyltransferase [Patescibacteria group bacterium]|nr:GNAT family N-acetyltransferase [Patescibacteria group bacterium]